MLEANIQIDDELAARGYRRALRAQAIKDISYYYAKNLTVIWFVIAAADALLGAGHLLTPHLLVILGLWVAASVYGYYEWTRRIALTRGWSFYAKLDEQGVVTSHPDENRVNWDQYAGYREYEDYLEIENQRGEISFLPKTPELFEIIEFTKRKLPQK